jgi:2-methylcitrate dehydratase PrpD
MTVVTPNADSIADFISGLPATPLPDQVAQAARMCLVDWLGVAIAGRNEGAAQSVRQVVMSWGTGDAHILMGGTASAAGAAMVNGTMAHCLDFDDTHVGSLAHLSGPSWAATFSLGSARGVPPSQMIRAFLAGFEVGGRLGGGGLGDALNERSLHSTGFIGCLAAAAASSALLNLDPVGIKRALGAAATQAAGLTASFGTMAKPFHAGKAAFNGVLSAELAAAGFVPALGLLEEEQGLAAALVQDRTTRIPTVDFNDGWEVLRNTFKPYASCLLTHPVVDAARELSANLIKMPIDRVRIGVHPMAIQLAGKPSPKTPLEGKFSTAFCAALGLAGHAASMGDFSSERLADPQLERLTALTELVLVPDMPKTAAWLEVFYSDGRSQRVDIPLARGNPGRPMAWDDLKAKFLGLAEPTLGSKAAVLFDHARRFETAEDFAAILHLTSSKDH